MQQYHILSALKLHGVSAFGTTEISPRMAIAYLLTVDSVQEQLKQNGAENIDRVISELNKSCMNAATNDKWRDNQMSDLEDDEFENDNENPSTWQTMVATRDDGRFTNQTNVILDKELSDRIGDYFMTMAHRNTEPTEYGLLLYLSQCFLNEEMQKMLQLPNPKEEPPTTPKEEPTPRHGFFTKLFGSPKKEQRAL